MQPPNLFVGNNMISLKSRVIVDIMNYFFLNNTEGLYVNEMVKKFAVDKRNLVKKLRELEREGLFYTEKKGSEIYYYLNKKFPLYHEYKGIILKTVGLEKQLHNLLKNVPKIEEVFIFGSYAKNQMDAASDIDVLVIGDANAAVVQKNISRVQKKLNREINAIVISRKELNDKLKKRDAFITQIFNDKNIKVV